MVRNYIRKTNNQIPEDIMRHAVAGKSIRSVANGKKINRQILCRYVALFKKSQLDQKEPIYKGHFCTRQVFTKEDEKILYDYIIDCSPLCYDLTSAEIR